MRALKILVVVMGIMLVVGFVALIVIVAVRVSHGSPSAGGSSGGGHPFATNTIDLPRGARIEAMTTAPNRLILELVLPDNERQLVIVDLTTGARIGTIELRSAP